MHSLSSDLAGFILDFTGVFYLRRSLPCFCCPLCVLPCIRLISFLLLPRSAFCCRFSVMFLPRTRSPCFSWRELFSVSNDVSFLLISSSCCPSLLLVSRFSPSWTSRLRAPWAFPSVSAGVGPWRTTFLGGNSS